VQHFRVHHVAHTLIVMNVFGIGIDVVEVGRIASSLEEFGERFVTRIFTERERDYCAAKAKPELHFAARFAAKEAVAKALGTGIGKEIGWLDMEVVRGDSGEPTMQLSGKALLFCEAHGIREIKISLTHAREYAAANAVALCGAQGVQVGNG
jgi:holo-[acyl-carrier protein] synthase